MTWLRILAFLACATSAAAAPLADKQILRQLGNAWLEQQAAKTWPGVRAQAEIGQFDERIELPACRDPQFFLSAGSHLGNSGSLGMRCRAPVWSLFLGYRLHLSGSALVTRRALPARAVLESDDLETRVIEYESNPSAYLSDPRQPAGTYLNRPLAAGQAVLADALTRPPAIRAGQSVRVVAQGAGFSVNQEGQALNTAAVGETVRVKTGSGRILQGVAQDDGSVLTRP